MVDVREKLSHAPIKEALIEFRVLTKQSVSAEALHDIQNQLSSQFPIVHEIHENKLNINVDADTPLQSFNKAFCGLRCESADGKDVMQVRFGGLTVSRLHPYRTWDDLMQSFQQAWSIYDKALDGATVTRVGVRYINRILLKFEKESLDLDDFFLFGVNVPDAFSKHTLSALCQVKHYDPPSGATANINLTTQKIEEGSLPVIFDIDAFRGGATHVDRNELWSIAEHLRELKNRIFFSSITESTLRLIE